MSTRAAAFADQGCLIVEHALRDADLDIWASAFAGAPGRRHPALPRAVRDHAARHPALLTLAAELAGSPARLVRAVAFEKTGTSSWFVPWHQDRTIAVHRRIDAAGFANWTEKGGEIHVEPPGDVLASMVTLQIHLDDCDADNGPLECVLGSHTSGRLDRAEIEHVVATMRGRLLLAARGDIVAMRPLTVHRSQRALHSRRRRVLHLEFATGELPHGLAWALHTAGAIH